MCGRYTRYLPWSEIHRLYRLTAPADVKQLLHENLDGDLEFYRVSRDVNTSAKDKQPYDLPSMIEPIEKL